MFSMEELAIVNNLRFIAEQRAELSMKKKFY